MFSSSHLRRARASRGLTQAELAERMERLGVECSALTVSRWERGVYQPAGIVTVAALLRVLRVPITALVTFEGDE